MSDLMIGTIQTMNVLRKIDTGYVLVKDMSEVLLHHNETSNELEENQEVDVFLYKDKKDQITATTKLPAIQKDVYGWSEVVEVVKNLGVFVDIGTTKEMLVSTDDLPIFQSVWPQVGDKLFVTLGYDRKGRLLAIPGSEEIFDMEWVGAPVESLNQTYNGRVYRTDKEGSVVLTEEKYRGFIHHSERKKEPRLGELINVRVIEVRADGSLNMSLRPLKQHGMLEDSDAILQHLENNNGSIPFNDKSNPEEILRTFNISKSAFKRALGKLMKEGKIEQRNGETHLK
ncbi:S1 RNA-binding domain-containing protein [Virgibacillus sp. DJP39]|uniref:CvfB family protein n=1 Tax=Virgibacillus sp. DJP39 TaxID=3409790 RepID=UPI003BB782EF